MLLQQQGSRVEVARPQVFSGRMEEVSVFINAARLYIRIKMMEEVAVTQVTWVLSYIQGGIAEAWKDSLLDELAKVLSLSLDDSRTTRCECLGRTQ